MSYRVNKTNGQILATIADGTLNNDTNLVLIGRNYDLYGEFFNENFVALLENAANDTAPINPLSGQLWFDTTDNILSLWNGSQWSAIGITNTGIAQPPNPIIGDLWFDPTDDQLYAWNGTGDWLLIGPMYPAEAGVSGTVVEGILDTFSNMHYVAVTYSDGERISIASNTAEFTPATLVPGFTTVRPGVQLAEFLSDSSTPLFDGTGTHSLLSDHALLADVATGALTIVDSGSNLIADVTNDRLTLNGEPIDDAHAATKLYVDVEIAGIDLTPLLRRDGTDAGMTGELRISYAASPRLSFQATTAGGTPNVTFVDTTGAQRAGMIYNDASGELILRRQASNGVTLSELIFDDNGNVSVDGTAPTEDNHLTRKDYIDGHVTAIEAQISDINLLKADITWVDNTFVELAGDTMTGTLEIAPLTGPSRLVFRGADPTNQHGLNIYDSSNVLRARLIYAESGNYVSLEKWDGAIRDTRLFLSDNGNVSVNGAIPTENDHLTRKDWVKAQDDLKVSKASDTMTGFLTLHADPVNNLHAATKQYADNAAFAENTLMLFAQASAPSGWVLDTTHNDRMLRVVDNVGAGDQGAGSGGTHDPKTMNKVPLHAHTGNTDTIGNHRHYTSAQNSIGGYTDNGGAPDERSTQQNIWGSPAGAHSHPITMDNNAGANAGNWTPKYLNIIVARKLPNP